MAYTTIIAASVVGKVLMIFTSVMSKVSSQNSHIGILNVIIL